MLLLQKKATQLSQPQGNAQIDWSNPITRGLAEFVSPAQSFTAVRNKPIVLSSGVSKSVNDRGIGFSGSVSNSQVDFGASAGLSTIVGADNFTIFARIYVTDAAASNQRILMDCNSGGGGAYSVMISINEVAGQWGFMVRTNTDYALNGGTVTVGWHDIALVQDLSNTNWYGYVDGVKILTYDYSSTSQLSSGTSLRLMANGAYTSGFGFKGKMACAGFFSRALTETEVKSLSANPWQIFKTLPQRIFIPIVASGATTYTLTAQPGTYSLTGQSATLLKHRTLTAQTGTYNYSGNNATITYNASAAVYTLTAQPGAYSYSGTAATILRHRNLTASTGAYSITGSNATISRNRNLIATTGTYSINGQQVTITRTTLTPVYTLTALPGSYSLSGSVATILKHRSLTAQTGVYTYTGRSIQLDKYAASSGNLVKYLDVLAGELLILKPLGASTPAGASAWGSITGTLSAQTDLQDALDLKADASAVPAQFNPIAGTNVTLSGTYPDITFNASGGSGATTSQISLDFGTVPVYSKAISFTDASITATSKIIMTPHATDDELEMDGFVCAVKCGTGTATAYIQAIPGPVTGTRLFNYTIG